MATDLEGRPADEVLHVDECAPDLLRDLGRLQAAVLLKLDGRDLDSGVRRHPDERAIGELDRGVSFGLGRDLVAGVQRLARGGALVVHSDRLVVDDQRRRRRHRGRGLDDQKPVPAAKHEQCREHCHPGAAQKAASASPAEAAGALLRVRGNGLLGDCCGGRWLNCHRPGTLAAGYLQIDN